MELTIKGFTDAESAAAKRNDCTVRLRVRENDTKSQMWKLLDDNSYESVAAVEAEITKIFKDLDRMIIELFDQLEGTHTKRLEEKEDDEDDIGNPVPDRRPNSR